MQTDGVKITFEKCVWLMKRADIKEIYIMKLERGEPIV